MAPNIFGDPTAPDYFGGPTARVVTVKMAPANDLVYLDYNATALLLPAAAERMMAAARDTPGNASSPHRFGQNARSLLERDRARLARFLAFDRREVIFTSGGSEGNNTVLHWLADLGEPAHLITSPIEHPSILRTCEWLQTRGVAVSYLPVDREGRVIAEGVADLIRPETRVVSVMAANNETGVIQPLANLVRAVRAAQGDNKPILIHTDAVQAFGRIPLPLGDWGIDAATITAHKLGGPKGIGALAIRDGWPIPPLIHGGRQERDRRAGTESVFLVEGFLAAAEYLSAESAGMMARIAGLRDRLIAALSGCEGFFVVGAAAERLPNTANVGFEGVSAQSLVVAMDLEGIAVSAGSACSSGSIEPSHVLRAMGLPETQINSALRISLGPGTTENHIARCTEVILRQAQRMRRRQKTRRVSA
ncbi:MAG: cysteine desulfurase [SAR324 cluster bacterium]|nr:cysteine desulfurase [SAR324 cluster bacterium]